MNNQVIRDPQQLSADQAKLMTAFLGNSGKLHIAMKPDTNGRAIRGKNVKFFDPDDASVAKRFIDAIRELVRLQLARQAGKRDHFELTNQGWMIGRRLAEKKQVLTESH